MAASKFVAYYRVSTAEQGRSGLGLEAQREAVSSYLNGGKWVLSAEFVEVESGKVKTRPQLEAALNLCELTGATLIVAKLDRLARDTGFLLALVDRGVDVVFCDLPALPAGAVGRFMLTQMVAVAELEAGLISARTKAALAAAKARGVKLGGNRGGALHLGAAASAKARSAASKAKADKVRGQIASIRASGAKSLRAIATKLNEQDVKTPRGGPWSPAQVKRVIDAG